MASDRQKMKNQPTFIMHNHLIASLDESKDASDITDGIKDMIMVEMALQYFIARLAAIVNVLGGKVVMAKPPVREFQMQSGKPPEDMEGRVYLKKDKSKLDENSPVYRGVKRFAVFPRDPVLCLPDLNIMLYPKQYPGAKMFWGGYIPSKKAIMSVAKDYKYLPVMESFFEGGNAFYITNQDKRYILHGMNPTKSKYVDHDVTYDPASPPYRIDPKETNKQIEKTLQPYDVKVIGVAINFAYANEHCFEEQYYHMDCFMQTLPDGRLIILNKNIIAQESYNELKNIFGDKLIDLGIDLNLNRQPVMFNLIAMGEGKETVVISPNQDEDVIAALKNHDIRVITPNMLDDNHSEYDPQFAEAVAVELNHMGYHQANPNNLLTPILENTKGYDLADGSHKDIGFFRDLLNAPRNDPVSQPVSQYMDELMRDFVINMGGPHCLTLEVSSSAQKNVTSPEQENSSQLRPR